ncbi:hypothetical protein FS749_010562 [Ceratobasidium sp. UAMH 11750]|nr:hypothetical protein FS749_010562 [Ceratobasidium sp. UAMH 11750]
MREERHLRDEEREQHIAAENAAARSTQSAPTFNLDTLGLLARMFGSNVNPLTAIPAPTIPAAPAAFAGGNPAFGVGANLGGLGANAPPTIQQPAWMPPQVQHTSNASNPNLSRGFE